MWKKGNKDWMKRLKHGRSLIYETLEDFQKPVLEYIEQTLDTKWESEEVSAGKVLIKNKAIPLTIKGLCGHLVIHKDTWYEYKKRKDFTDFCTRVEEFMRNYTMTGAFVGDFNHALTARYYGISDSNIVESKGDRPIVIVSSKENESRDSEAIENLKE